MNRRGYLTLGATIGTVLVGGCTSTTQLSENQQPNEAQNREKAQEYLEKAGTALQNAGDEMIVESDKLTSSDFEEGSVDIVPVRIYGYLDTASTHLDKAANHADKEQQERINVAREYIVFARKVTELMDTFAEGYSEASAGFRYYQSERYSDATSELKKAEKTFAEMDDLLTVTQSRYEDLDKDALSEMDSVEIASFESSLEKLDTLIPALGSMIKGTRKVSEGMTDLTTAIEEMENEAYGDAEASYKAANEDFSAAYSIFKEQEDSAPADMKTTFIKMTCYSRALRDSSRHFANAMEAIQNGNEEQARSEVEEARAANSRCSFSS